MGWQVGFIGDNEANLVGEAGLYLGWQGGGGVAGVEDEKEEVCSLDL